MNGLREKFHDTRQSRLARVMKYTSSLWTIHHRAAAMETFPAHELQSFFSIQAAESTRPDNLRAHRRQKRKMKASSQSHWPRDLVSWPLASLSIFRVEENTQITICGLKLARTKCKNTNQNATVLSVYSAQTRCSKCSLALTHVLSTEVCGGNKQ